jgi:hypothetical protein
MKKFRALALLGLSVAGSGAAMGTSQSLNEFTPTVLPVLVQVDSHGKVTAVSPSIELSPRFERLLRQTVDELITKPASDHGRPVASQFVMNLALGTSPRSDGAYDARFAYVSMSPVPSGSWYWVHVDGHRLALMSQDAARPGRVFHAEHGWDQRWLPQRSPRLDSPVQSASHQAVQPLRASSFGRPTK